MLASGFILSCEDHSEEQHPSIDTDYYEMDFTVQATDRSGFHIFAEKLFTSDMNDILSKAGLTDNQVEAVILKEAQVSLLEAENHTDFDILKFLELTVYTDSLGETKIAWSDPVPADRSTVTLDLTEENILPYFKEDIFILTAQGYLKERVYENVKLHAKIKFQIKQ